MEEFDFLFKGECPDCNEEFGPPPDDIINIPPPPLPYFIDVAHHNESSFCMKQCTWTPKFPGIEFIELTHRRSTPNDTWLFILTASCLGILILGGLLTLLLLKFRSKISTKNSVQASSTIVKTKGCESVLYPYPTTIAPDSKVLWATLTPRGTTHHYTTPITHPNIAAPPYSSPCKPTLPPPDPPISFDNTGFVDSDSQTPLMESYQLSELIDSDCTSNAGTLKTAQRPKVSSPTRIENPNLPPLNLHPHRTFRKATIQRRDSDLPYPPSN